MYSKSLERLNKFKKYLVKTYPNGKFKADLNIFKKVLGVSTKPSCGYYLSLLEKENFIERTNEAKQGIVPEYSILSLCKKDIAEKKENKMTLEEINASIMVNKEDEKEKKIDNKNKSKVDSNDYIVEKFNNIKMRLYRTEKGYAIPIADIAKGLNITTQAIHQLLERNKELFQEWLINVTLIRSTSGNKNTCLTRDGIIGLLMKISYSRLDEKKQKNVLQFQKWAVTKLGQLVSSGEVKLNEHEHAQVQQEVKETLNLSETDIDMLFNDLEKIVSEKIQEISKVAKIFQNKVEQSERDNLTLKTQNERLISNTVALREKIYSIR